MCVAVQTLRNLMFTLHHGTKHSPCKRICLGARSGFPLEGSVPVPPLRPVQECCTKSSCTFSLHNEEGEVAGWTHSWRGVCVCGRHMTIPNAHAETVKSKQVCLKSTQFPFWSLQWEHCNLCPAIHSFIMFLTFTVCHWSHIIFMSLYITTQHFYPRQKNPDRKMYSIISTWTNVFIVVK